MANKKGPLVNTYDGIVNYTLDLCKKDPLKEKIDGYVNSINYIYGAMVEGDVAEFGTASGRSSAAIAAAMEHQTKLFQNWEKRYIAKWNRNVDIEHLRHIKSKKLYLLDSFDGFPPIGPEDQDMPMVKTKLWVKGSCRGLKEDELYGLISSIMPSAELETVKGFYSESLSKVDFPKGLALVHLDCDLYHSTKDVLQNLFGKNIINKGSILLFDDYNCNAADPNLGQRRAWKETVEEFDIEYEDQGCYSFDSTAILVHNYRAKKLSP